MFIENNQEEQNLFEDNLDIQQSEPRRAAFDQNLEKKIQKLRSDAESQRNRTWAFYQELKKSNPTEYWRPKTQVQMHKDAEALGDAFANGDFSDE